MRATVIGVSCCALALGLIAPRAAIRSAHALVAVLSVLLLIVLIQPVLSQWEIRRAQPFAKREFERTRSISPAVIVEIADEVASAKRVVTPKLRSRIGKVAHGRLDDQHQARVSSTLVADDVRALLSPTLHTILTDDEKADDIPIGELESLITEVEGL